MNITQALPNPCIKTVCYQFGFTFTINCACYYLCAVPVLCYAITYTIMYRIFAAKLAHLTLPPVDLMLFLCGILMVLALDNQVVMIVISI